MEKTDIRVQYTRKVLQDSLIELMKEKSILKISIREICDRSGVSRSTFYTYFKDQYDLLRQLEEQSSLEAEEIIQRHTRTGQKSGRGEITAIMQDLLQYVVNNINSIQVLLSENGDNVYQRKYFQSAIGQIQRIMEAVGINQPDKKAAAYGAVFIMGGTITLIQEWLKNSMDIPVPHLAKMLARHMQEALS
jgi:AcrR family transcriptional regulator